MATRFGPENRRNPIIYISGRGSYIKCNRIPRPWPSTSSQRPNPGSRDREDHPRLRRGPRAKQELRRAHHRVPAADADLCRNRSPRIQIRRCAFRVDRPPQRQNRAAAGHARRTRQTIFLSSAGRVAAQPARRRPPAHHLRARSGRRLVQRRSRPRRPAALPRLHDLSPRACPRPHQRTDLPCIYNLGGAPVSPWRVSRPASGGILSESRQGLILINTGPGKGKTTAAMGTALRAVGNGMKVLMLQFLKGSWHYGELDAVKAFGDNFVMKQMGRGFVKVGGAETDPEDVRMVEEAWEEAEQAIISGQWDLVILDEINYAISYKML